MNETPILNEHNKQEHPPMHTAEHILNGTMVKTFGCNRAKSAHIERKKSKCDYDFPRALTQQEIQDLEDKVNAIIAQNLPVTMEFAEQNDVADRFDLNRLPDGASQMVRIGTHVENTSQIGHFRISSTRYQDDTLRIVFRLDENKE